MEARAIAKTLRVSPIKARLVVDLIRGKNVNVAFADGHVESATPLEIATKHKKGNAGTEKDYIDEVYYCNTIVNGAWKVTGWQ